MDPKTGPVAEIRMSKRYPFARADAQETKVKTSADGQYERVRPDEPVRRKGPPGIMLVRPLAQNELARNAGVRGPAPQLLIMERQCKNRHIKPRLGYKPVGPRESVGRATGGRNVFSPGHRGGNRLLGQTESRCEGEQKKKKQSIGKKPRTAASGSPYRGETAQGSSRRYGKNWPDITAEYDHIRLTKYAGLLCRSSEYFEPIILIVD